MLIFPGLQNTLQAQGDWAVGMDFTWKVRESRMIDDPGGYISTTQDVPNFSYGFWVNYNHPYWLIQAGLGRSTFNGDLNFKYAPGAPVMTNRGSGPYEAFQIPLRLSYRLVKFRRLAFFPTVGISANFMSISSGSSRGGQAVFSEIGHADTILFDATIENVRSNTFTFEAGGLLLWQMSKRFQLQYTVMAIAGTYNVVAIDVEYEVGRTGENHTASIRSRGTGLQHGLGLRYLFQ